MSQVVFILGAGASRQAGAPLMADFLDRAEHLMAKGRVPEHEKHFRKVFEAIARLQSVNYKSYLDLDNLESVFAAFEMGKLTGTLGGLSREQIEDLVGSMRWVIWSTLENTMNFPGGEGREGSLPGIPVPYRSFAELVRDLNASGSVRCSVITLNYDLALDYALARIGPGPAYCLATSTEAGTPLLKLHGSLNWCECKTCKAIVPWEIRDFFQRFHYDEFALREAESVHLDLSRHLSRSGLKHCDEDIIPEPYIVPPTWNKAQYHASLSRVWGRAAQELGTAEYVFVSGYSLPDTDMFFRYLFALGITGETRVKRFCVYDPNPDDVGPRFEKLLGSGLRQRFEVKEATFGTAIGEARGELKGSVLKG